MLKEILFHKRIRLAVWLVATIFLLTGYSFQSAAGSAYYALVFLNHATVASPPVILEEGTAGISTIYTNSTSAKVSVEAPLSDYVDSSDIDVDSNADRGMHSNFTAQQACQDAAYDSLTEENTEAIEDYVDNDASDIDGSGDKGTLSDFDNMKTKDGMANLTEAAGGTPTDLQVPITCMDQMWDQGPLYEWYSAWTPPGSGTVTVTKLWFWDGDGTVGTGETIYMAMYENGGGYSKLSGSDTTLAGTGSQGWLSADVSTSFEITLGTTYWIGATCASGDTYNICRDDGANSANYPPNGVGTYYQTNNYVLDSSVPTGATQSINKYIIPGITYTTGTGDYELDQEVQFTNVNDFLPTEKLCIYAGPLGDEDLRVDYWNGTGWENLATDLVAFSCNEYTVSVTSANFTIRFKGGTETSDTTQDQWQIAACLLRVEGAGNREDAVDNDTSDVDSSTDLGNLISFDNMKASDSTYANLTESAPGGITYINNAEASATSGTSAQINKPAGTAEDDFMIALLVSTIGGDIDGSTMFSAPSGWTNEHDYIQSATSGQHVYIYWRIAGASEPSSYTWTWTSSCGWIAQIATFRGVDPSSPIHVEGTVNQETSASPMSPSVTTTVANCMIWLYDTSDGDAVPATGGAPSGTTWIDQTEIATPGNGAGISTAYFVQASAGATGNRDWTLDVIDENSGQQYALKPAPTDYQLDQEVQWIGLPYLLPNENLSIYGGTMGAEDIKVDVWNGTGWETVFTDLSSGWNNASITDWLTTPIFTIRFKGGNETGDPSQDTWQIDVALIRLWHDGGETYQLDLEVQWTGAVYTRTNEELCIRTGTFSGSENIQVRVWNSTGSSWYWVMNLTANQWNNVSITSYLTSSTLTVGFLGGTETGDTIQDSWNIDVSLLRVWTSVNTFDYVDSDTSDVDSSADKGTHGNFSAQQAGPDSIYDTLTEGEAIGVVVIEDYVDQVSNVDGVSDLGSHDGFADLQASDNTYDNITEASGGSVAIAKVSTDTSTSGNSMASLSWSHTLVSGSNRVVVVGISIENGDTISISNVTYGGEAMTEGETALTSTSGFRNVASIYYILEADLPTDGSKTVEVICSGTANAFEIWAICAQYTGVSQSAPETTDETVQTTPATISNTISPSTDAWVLSVVTEGNVGDWAHGQGQVEVEEFDDASSTSAYAELRGASGETSVDSTFTGTVNRLARVACSFMEAVPSNFQMDLEVQFSDVMDFMAVEYVCIETGAFYGSEDINVTYWTGSVWASLASDMAASTWNNYSVSLTSSNFTVKFGGSDTASDSVQDGWEIDSILLQYSGAGSDEDFVDQTSNVDGVGDVGLHDTFADLQASDDSYDNMTETGGDGTVWLWQEDTSGYTSTSSYETYEFWNSWTTNSTTSGTITKLGIYVFANPGNSPQVKLGIYDDSGGSPNNLLGETNAATITGMGWLDLDIVGGDVNISASTTYHVSHITDIAPTTAWRYLKTAAPVSDFRNNRVWPNFFDPAGTTTKSGSYRYGAYRVGYDEPSDYTLELEVQFTGIPDEADSMSVQRLCIEAGTLDSEDILVQWWNGSGWETLWSDLTSSSWNNASIAGNLTGSTFTIRFRDGAQSGDTTTADSWFIDSVLIYLDNPVNYEIDLEIQWTNVDYTRKNEQLCIATGSLGSETLMVYARNASTSSWHWIMNLTASQWNNVSITSYLTSNTFTVRFLGGTETGDTTQNSWSIDVSLLHVWTAGETYDYVLRVNNTVTDSWEIRLKTYSSSSINRLENCTIYFHNSTDGTSPQIVIENKAFVNETGAWYDLDSLETIYIAMTAEAVSTGTSYIYVNLEIRVPNTTTYLQCMIVFEIT